MGVVFEAVFMFLVKSTVGFRAIAWIPACAASSSSCTHSRLGKAPNLQRE